MHRVVPPLTLLLALGACTGSSSDTEPAGEESPSPESSPVSIRVATFNASLYRDSEGALRRELESGDSVPASLAAGILQTVRPDIVLVNEFDHDPTGGAVEAFVQRYLAVSQDGLEPLELPHSMAPEVNTGEPSGLDLDGDGRDDHPIGSQGYAADAWGFGRFPGQYGMVLLSRFPILSARTFRTLRWADVPDNQLPEDHYSAAAQAALRLSSKTHADVTIEVAGRPLHLLISHPTPPAFDGPEDRNGRRNHDEIRLWSEYIAGEDWIVDDDGVSGGLDSDASFIILGDLNADPFDGGSRTGGIDALLAHARTTDAEPASDGAVAAATDPSDEAHRGPSRLDTADFGPDVGNLRVDYVLPSADLTVRGAGVYWPKPDEPGFERIGVHPFPLTDHRPVWVDLVLP